MLCTAGAVLLALKELVEEVDYLPEKTADTAFMAVTIAVVCFVEIAYCTL